MFDNLGLLWRHKKQAYEPSGTVKMWLGQCVAVLILTGCQHFHTNLPSDPKNKKGIESWYDVRENSEIRMELGEE